MLYRLGLIALLLTLFASTASAQSDAGKIQGTVVDDNGDPLSFVAVKLFKDDNFIKGVNTNMQGEFEFRQVDPGTYSLQLRAQVGDNELNISGILVKAGETKRLGDLTLTNQVTLGTVDIVYEEDIVEADNTTRENTITGEEIQQLGTRSLNSYAQQAGGIYSADEGGALNFRGQRSGGTQYVVDGMRMSASAALTQGAIENLTVIKGGTPAEYGDATGGFVSITTSGPSGNFRFGGEVVSSQLTDPYNYNLVALNSSGPIIKGKSPGSGSILGYFIAAEFEHRLDRDPAGPDLFELQDGLLQDLQERPVEFSEDFNIFVNRASFLRDSNFQTTNVKPNNGFQGIRLNGRLDFKLNEGAFLKVGYAMNLNEGDIWSLNRHLFTPQANELRTEKTHRGFVRFNQLITSDDEDDFIQSISYTLQGEYTRFERVREDRRHRDNFFDYGHVGVFERERAPQFDFVQPGDPTHNPNLSSSGYWQLTGFVDTSYVMVRDQETGQPISSNPLQANYNEVIYDYYARPENARPVPFFTGDVFGINSRTGVFNRLDLLNAGGIINGFNTPTSNPSMNVYSLFEGQGSVLPFYAKQQNEQFRFWGQATLQMGRGEGTHNVKLGFEFEQRFQRFFSINTTRLWPIMDNLANQHIANPDTSTTSPGYNPIFENGVFQDTVFLDPLYVPEDQSEFDKNLRQMVYGNIRDTRFLNVDAFGPEMYSLDMFSANELLNNGNSLVTYYGYDYTGDLADRSSPEEFFNDSTLRPQSAFAPTYLAGYIQDKFEIENAIFRIGFRVDRLDLNQQVLRDKFIMAPFFRAAETASEQFLNLELPSNIDPNWVAYVDDPLNPTQILGYRDGDVWLDATGAPTSPLLLQGSDGRVNPHLQSEELTIDAFEDYTPQINIMPRIAFSFPINDRSNFFAHYDVLTQRPGAFQIGQFTDYLFIQQNATVAISNPNLKPERTVDYEVGFKQAVTPKIGITLSAYYREMRDMIQVVRNNSAYPITYDSYENVDFGTVKGFNLEVETKRLGLVKLRANYTLQFATGTGSSFSSSRNALNQIQGFSLLRNELPLTFDQRHTITGQIDFRFTGKPQSMDKDLKSWGPKIGKVYPFKNFGLNLSWTVGSGTPFTFFEFPNRAEVQFGINSNTQTSGQPLSGQLPFNYRLNLRVDKVFNIMLNKSDVKSNDKAKPRYMSLNVYLLITNLLDTRNVLNVYGYSGLPDDSGFLDSPFADAFIASEIDRQSFIDLYRVKEQNPNNFSLPRQVRLGLMFSF